MDKLKKITDTIEVRLANVLEDSGYKDAEDMDGEDFAMLRNFILALIKEVKVDVLENALRKSGEMILPDYEQYLKDLILEIERDGK